MKLALVLMALLGATVAATAQTKFVPFTVDEKSAQELQTWLAEQPFKFSAPVLQWIAAQEKRASDAEAAKDAAKAPAKK
jgi:hypothetical protein